MPLHLIVGTLNSSLIKYLLLTLLSLLLFKSFVTNKNFECANKYPESGSDNLIR